MAKAATKAPKAKKKDKPAKPEKASGKAKGKTIKKAAGNAADALWKLAENPLIGEMLAIGAGAAVAALAESGIAGKGKKKISSKAIKGAGKAAAAAIGARLVGEFTGLSKPSRATKPAKPTKSAKAAKPAKPARAKTAKA
jgi:hypothetical protein